ncbi:helix-turn-helix domain-containing protein [Blastococcus sp. SYSU DS0539]
MLTVDQAAERLGVEPEQVRRLIRAGKLAARRVGRTLVLDEDAVEGRARLPITAGRALAPRTVWAALWQLSGEDVDWLAPADRSRLLTRLHGYDAERLVAAARDRAERHELRVLPAYRQRLLAADGVVPSGLTAAAAVGADIVAAEAAAEVYCAHGTLDELRRELGLSERGEANLVVRVPRYDGLELAGRTHMPAAVVAVDLAESPDVRTRRAGLDLLTDALGDLPR